MQQQRPALNERGGGRFMPLDKSNNTECPEARPEFVEKSERGAALASREGIPRVPVGGSPLALPGPADMALPRGASREQGRALGCLQCPRFSALLDSQEGWVCRARGSRAV